jgi:hypothetical protein
MTTPNQREWVENKSDHWREQVITSNKARSKYPHTIRNEHEGKVCSGCGYWRYLTNFHKDRSRADGFDHQCKKCISKKRADHYNRTIDLQRKWRQSPKRQKWSRQYQAEWSRLQRATNPEYRLKKHLRTRVYRALKGIRKETPTMTLLGCTVEELKAHLEQQFVDEMSWDNYGRRGWEMDHIIPCASFDLMDPVQLAECFHYTNLQPLWGPDNWRKGSKISWVA